MIRWSLLALFAAGAVAFSLWIYLRVDLAVPSARRLAALRAAALVLVLLLLFDVRLPVSEAGASPDWVLLDASLSMGAAVPGGASAWDGATARAREYAAEGWNVAVFGGEGPGVPWSDELAPNEVGSRLAPALERAAESGARRVVVLSDLRFEDAVAVRGTIESLPLEVAFEGFGGAVPNVGVSRLDVPDFAQSGEPVTAEVEIHGGEPGDTVTVDVLAEGAVVATLRVPAPAAGLRASATAELPPPDAGDRVRYTAVVSSEGDAFPSDDGAVDYAAVGREEGALVLVSFTPDWEPRYLLPVLAEVTGLPTAGFLRAGPDRWVRAGRAVDRGGPVDSAAVRRAVDAAAIVVVHGLRAGADPWAHAIAVRPGRKVLMAHDPAGAAAADVEAGPARPGEWYVSADVPTSPIAGSLSGVTLQGLPPLGDVLVVEEGAVVAPLLVQLRGAGEPEPALLLAERPSGRTAVALASGFWRWAARPSGREPYRRLWSGVVGWILADQSVASAEARPTRWVVPRDEPVSWSLPADSSELRVVVQSGEGTMIDTVLAPGGVRTSGPLPPGTYAYTVERSTGDTVGAGRFDVAEATEEMLPPPQEPGAPGPAGAGARIERAGGRPLRTMPWPYLLIITLLCLEWVGRRRAGLR